MQWRTPVQAATARGRCHEEESPRNRGQDQAEQGLPCLVSNVVKVSVMKNRMLINSCTQILDMDPEAEEGATKAIDSSKKSSYMCGHLVGAG